LEILFLLIDAVLWVDGWMERGREGERERGREGEREREGRGSVNLITHDNEQPKK
jgi:hypothetical protein